MAFPRKIYSKLVSFFFDLCKSSRLVGICDQPQGKTIFDNGVHFKLSKDQINAYPTLTFTFNKMNPIDLLPSSYLVPQKDGKYSMGISSCERDLIILGDTFMIGFHVAFDIHRNMIGFAHVSTCPSFTISHRPSKI